MSKKAIMILLTLVALVLTAYQGTTILAAPAQQSATTTPEAQEEAAETDATSAITETESIITEPTLADLAASINALQARVDALTASAAGQANEVTTAVYLLDTAGLHGLDERLNGEGLIESSDSGKVARVARLLSSVDWPASLAEDAATLTETLNQLAAALGEDDLETAAPLSTQAHEQQHSFSHEAEHWLGEVTVVSSEHADAGQVFRVTSAVYLLDTAGLHGLDERLNGEGLIESSDSGKVARVARLLSSVDWPASLAEDAATLTETLNQLAAALGEDDLETAAPLSTQAHEQQHDFSHGAEHWLGEGTGGHGDEDSHGEGDAREEEEPSEGTGG